MQGPDVLGLYPSADIFPLLRVLISGPSYQPRQPRNVHRRRPSECCPALIHRSPPPIHRRRRQPFSCNRGGVVHNLKPHSWPSSKGFVTDPSAESWAAREVPTIGQICSHLLQLSRKVCISCKSVKGGRKLRRVSLHQRTWPKIPAIIPAMRATLPLKRAPLQHKSWIP